MDRAVHRNDPGAAPRGSPGPFAGRAPRRGAAGCSFAFNSLLARHFPRFANELFRRLREWKSCLSPTSDGSFWTKREPASALLAPLSLPALPRSARGSVRAGAMWRKTAPGAQSTQDPVIKQDEPEPHSYP